MTGGLDPPITVLRAFSVSDPEFVEETALAVIYKVRSADGASAALKIYKDAGMANERPGFAFLEALNGDGAARVRQVSGNAALIEWLDGPSLGDLTRRGEDERAATKLVEAANRIHARPRQVSEQLPVLADWFDALFKIEFAPDCPPATRRDLMFCRETARRLCDDQQDVRPMHGDLHHDNIRLTDRGPCAFDAKGVVGERCFELANAFRNPRGVPDLVRNPKRARYLCDFWSREFRVAPTRLIEWAAVKCALSICWRCEDQLAFDEEFDLLSLFVGIVRDGPGPD